MMRLHHRRSVECRSAAAAAGIVDQSAESSVDHCCDPTATATCTTLPHPSSTSAVTTTMTTRHPRAHSVYVGSSDNLPAAVRRLSSNDRGLGGAAETTLTATSAAPAGSIDGSSSGGGGGGGGLPPVFFGAFGGADGVGGRKNHVMSSLQGQVYNFLERPTGWKCFVYHFTVYVSYNSQLLSLLFQ